MTVKARRGFAKLVVPAKPTIMQMSRISISNDSFHRFGIQDEWPFFKTVSVAFGSGAPVRKMKKLSFEAING